MKVKCPGCETVMEVNPDMEGNKETFVVRCGECSAKLKLKKKKDQKKKTEEKEKAAEKTGGRILIIDDTKFFRMKLKEMLEAEGCDVITAENGKKGLKAIKSEYSELDLVLLDLLLPKMTGFDVLKEVRKTVTKEELSILAITGVYKGQEEIQKLRESGANGYVKKDEEDEHLLFRINQAMKQ